MRITFVMRIVGAIVIFLTIVALYWSTRFAFADWLSTSPIETTVVRATALAPQDTSAWLRLADVRSTRDEDDLTPLRRALETSPHDSHIWIQLGLDLEARQQYAEAQRCLTRAVELDRDFIPIWTLTNYYFRRGDETHFFPSARRTLAFSGGDLRPLFRMCWNITEDGPRILGEAIPDKDDVLSAYLEWLGNQTDRADPVAKRLLDRFPQEGTPALLDYCDRLIAANRLDRAVEFWNQMSARGVVRTGPVRDDEIVDGAFHSPALNSGFGWRVGSPAGIDIALGGGSLNLSFSGSEGDHCNIANELALIQPGRTWRLNYHFVASGLEAGAGLHWLVSDARTGVPFMGPLSQFSLEPRDFAMAKGGQGDFTFIVPPAPGPAPLLARIALVYDRDPASARMEGWIRVDKVWLEESKGARAQ